MSTYPMDGFSLSLFIKKEKKEKKEKKKKKNS